MEKKEKQIIVSNRNSIQKYSLDKVEGMPSFPDGMMQ